MKAFKIYTKLLLATLFASGAVNAQNFRLPPYQKFTLKNGLTVYLMEQHEVPEQHRAGKKHPVYSVQHASVSWQEV